jgi:hypothetical protein
MYLTSTSLGRRISQGKIWNEWEQTRVRGEDVICFVGGFLSFSLFDPDEKKGNNERDLGDVTLGEASTYK